MKSFLRRSLSPVILLSLFAACGKSEEKRTPTPAATAVVQAKPAEVEIEESLLTPFCAASCDNRFPYQLAHRRQDYARAHPLLREARLDGQRHLFRRCHNLATNGAQTTKTSEGHKQAGKRKILPLCSMPGHFAQFWDRTRGHGGRAGERAHHQPHRNGHAERKGRPRGDLTEFQSQELFKKAFPADEKSHHGIDNLSMAIGAFERKLVTPSRWSKYLKGDETALTSAEKEGFNKFSSVGCVTCHSGEYLHRKTSRS